MKKFSLFKSLTILFIVFAFTVSKGQNPTVIINCNLTGLAPGTPISVPVVLNGTSVGNWRFIIKYDRDVLTYVSTTNTVSSLGIGSFSYNANYTIPSGAPNAGEIAINAGFAYTDYQNGGTGHDYINQPVCTFNFIFVGGATNFTFLNITGLAGSWDTSVKANPYNVVNTGTVYTTGSASGAYGTLNSIAGGGDWKTAATWVENKLPTRAYNVVVTGNTVTDTSATGRCNNLTINAGGKLTVAAGKSLAVSGSMLVKSDVSGTGSFIDLGTTTVTGSNSVERYTTGNWSGNWPPTFITWHYVSSPVSGGTINSFLGSLLNYWDEPLATWQPMTLPLTTALVPDKGYSAATTSPQVITFTGGTLNTGDQIISGLTRTGTGLYAGFNLVGNPYPSALKWNVALSDRTNVDAAGYFWSGSTYTAHLATDVTPYEIPAEQGFYVMVNAIGFGAMTLRNANRVHSSGAYQKNSANEQLSLKVTGNNLEDVTSIRFNTEASEGFDGEYDAFKLWGINTCPQIYSITASDNLAINTLPAMTNQTVIPVGFKTGVTETYTITASGMETFVQGTDIFLEDLLLNKTQNLNTNPVYEFAAATGNGVHRFDIHFSPISGIANGTTTNIKIYSSENNVYVNIPMELNGEIIVYDLLGKEVKRQPIESNTLNKITLNVDLGYYLVKILADKSAVSGKVLIR